MIGLDEALAGLIVLGAVVYLVRHFTKSSAPSKPRVRLGDRLSRGIDKARRR